jgi:hypothetical protein
MVFEARNAPAICGIYRYSRCSHLEDNSFHNSWVEKMDLQDISAHIEMVNHKWYDSESIRSVADRSRAELIKRPHADVPMNDFYASFRQKMTLLLVLQVPPSPNPLSLCCRAPGSSLFALVPLRSFGFHQLGLASVTEYFEIKHLDPFPFRQIRFP